MRKQKSTLTDYAKTKSRTGKMRLDQGPRPSQGALDEALKEEPGRLIFDFSGFSLPERASHLRFGDTFCPCP